LGGMLFGDDTIGADNVPPNFFAIKYYLSL
jgi:hypothetical protein